MRLKDLTGQKFGRLTVIERAPNKGKKTMWRCKCDCGTYVNVSADNLASQNTASCGCLRVETARKKSTKHGHKGERIYNIWCGMKRRCYNMRDVDYGLYGANGISVCDEWLHDFQRFYEWAIANGYRDDLFIERKNGKGNYEPSNCCWATIIEQNNNTSRNAHITYRNVTHTVAQWAKLKGLTYSTLQHRLSRGWSAEEALETPTKKR